uniref:Sema domain-containing protein n=1 Tax=Malurus cyaneus samueli TaxID=2593467 RepID=A0A8C5TYZ1_9PASS
QIMWGPTAEKASECAFKKKSQEVRWPYGGSGSPTKLLGWMGVPTVPHPTMCHRADGELYAGTMNNFQGNEPIISRSLGSRTLLKTDAFLRWLSEPVTSVMNTLPLLQSDVGGDKVLQKKWTTFLKAQLVCSQPGRFPFNVIHHAFALPRHDGRADFYAVFTSQWQAGRAGSAAVCAYTQEDLEKVFEGKYKELNKESSRWTVYSGPDMSPRPGSCSMGPSSDKALTFMKDHFLMDGKVFPIQGQPLLVKSDVTYTRITVGETRSISGTTYRVMFLVGHTQVTNSHPTPAPDTGQRLSPAPVPPQGILYVGYSRGILQIPLANCSLHRSCAECVLARDPYCAWHSPEGSCQSAWLQDIETGNPASCPRGRSAAMPRAWGLPEDPTPNTVVQLPCPRHSALATYSWQQPGSSRGHTALLPDHTLVVIMQQGMAGSYKCVATENGFTWTVAHYQLGNSGAFVTVTVLLALTLTVAACLALLACRDQLKARSKVRGCSTPHSPPSRHREKVPLNGGTEEVPAPGVKSSEQNSHVGKGRIVLKI